MKSVIKKGTVPFFATILSLFFLTASAQAETLTQRHNLQGVVHLRERNLEDAKKEFIEALKADPNYAPAHNNLGFLLYQEAVTKPKEDGSRRLQSAYPNERRIPPVQSGVAVTSNLVNEALEHLQVALKHADGRKNIIRQAKENLALLYTDTRINPPVRQGHWHKKGVKIYESLIREEPDNPEYHMRLGFAYFNISNPGGGFSELEKASQLAKSKDTLWIHKELQKFYMQINFVTKAVKEQEIIERLGQER